MEIINLVFPDTSMKQSVLAFKEAFYQVGEHTIPGSYKLDNDRIPYDQWIDILNMNLSKGTANPKFGTSETYLALDRDATIVGIANLRHELTHFYQDSGHIGYSVHPAHRRQGYAKAILCAVLEKAKKHGMDDVKLVCADRNIASRKTIESCGGIVTRAIPGDDGMKYEYIITLR